MQIVNDVILRDWNSSDASDLVGHLNNTNVIKNLPNTVPTPFTIRHARVYIGMINYCHNHLNKVIEWNGKFVGAVVLIPQENIWKKNAEIQFFIGEIYWGNGIMTQALKKMIHYAFENFDFTRIYTFIFENNKAGQQVLKHAGFQEEGLLRQAVLKDDVLHNVVLYSILRESVASQNTYL